MVDDRWTIYPKNKTIYHQTHASMPKTLLTEWRLPCQVLSSQCSDMLSTLMCYILQFQVDIGATRKSCPMGSSKGKSQNLPSPTWCFTDRPATARINNVCAPPFFSCWLVRWREFVIALSPAVRGSAKDIFTKCIRNASAYTRTNLKSALQSQPQPLAACMIQGSSPLDWETEPAYKCLETFLNRGLWCQVESIL